MPSIFRVLLTLAALFTAPVASFLAGHDWALQLCEFLAALLALFLRSPLPSAKKELDL